MPTKRQPPSAYRPPPAADSVGRERSRYLGQTKSMAPSAAAQPKEFAKRQGNPATAIHCDRPRHATNTIPVTLLHPVFGEFLDDIQTHESTAEDNKLVVDFSEAMADVYEKEMSRGAKIREVLGDAGITLVGSVIEGTSYTTDGDMQHYPHRYVIAELKNEIGSKAAEPYAQAATYYLESTRKLAPHCPKSSLPCFLLYIYIFGNLRPTIQVLSTVLPLHFHYSDSDLRITTARHLGALKKAINSLRKYYEHELRVINNRSLPLSPQPRIPRYTTSVTTRNPYLISSYSLARCTKFSFD